MEIRPPVSKTYFALGALLVGTGAMVAYAKYDEDFRSWLTDNSPLADQFVSFITAEEVSQVEFIMKLLSDFKNM